MFKNYFKIMFRNIKKHKGYSFINIAGLAIGITCCIFILLYVRFELSFDDYHEDLDRIYFVALSSTSENGHSNSLGNMSLLAPTLKEKFPQVENSGLLNSGWIVQVQYEDKVFKEQGLWNANPDLLQVFSIPFIQGDPESAIDRPNTAVLTEQMANKYFGNKNPLGEKIKVNETEYEITGIVKNSPLNTDFSYDIIMSWKTVENEEWHQGWHPGVTANLCIIKLIPGTNSRDFEKLISELNHEYAGEALKEKGLTYRNFLFPLKDLHLYSLSGDGIKPSTHLVYIYIFSAVGLLILIIACINFMNLATARSSNRSKEVGMRKVIGAQRKQLIWQFLGESIFISFVSLGFAIILILLLMPFYNEIANTQFSAMIILQPDVTLGLLVLVLFIGIIAGGYPALILSAFKPAFILRGLFKTGHKGSLMRRVLVVGQFTISIVLIIATIVVYKQLDYMKNQPLGFDKEQKLVINLKKWRMITDKYESVKNEFLKHPSVLKASASSGVPGSQINRTWIYPKGKEAEQGRAFRSLRSDHDFMNVYDVDLIAGRMFDKKIQSDVIQSIIINEEGVKAFGWKSPEEAIGQELWERGYPIIGVVKNFHWWGLQRSIEPLLVRVVPELLRSITLEVRTENLSETLAFVEKKYKELFPGDVFEYFFVDANFDLQYRAEERLGRIFQIFTFIGLFVACLGLFGMASFISEQRTKEIGIRKTLGASVSKIVLLLSKEFIKWVFIANLIAWPIAYFISTEWLQNFAYRIEPGIAIFLLSTALAIIISFITVSYQSIKTALTNPVESLRYE